MELRLDHVQLAVPPGKEADIRRFYGELLGLREIAKPAALSARGGVWFELSDGRQLHLGVEIEFAPQRKAHACFVVGAIEELARLLDAAGFPTRFDALVPPIVRFYTHDPFGNRLEFADRFASQMLTP